MLIAIIGMFFTFTNFVYLSALPSILASLAVFYVIKKNTLPKFLFWLVMFYLYNLISVLLYSPQSIFEFGFLRYDGNFIISYAAFLFLPLFSYKINIDKLFYRFLLFVTFINSFYFMYYVIFLNGTFGSLFVARNAAGGFLSITLALAFVYFIKNKSPINFIILTLNFVFLIFTYSRGSILGLLAGLIYYWLFIHRKYFLLFLGFAIIIAVQTVLIYKFYPLYQETTSYNEVSDEKMGTKEANIFIRLLDNWPSGVDCFLHSPILGTGLGSLNDKPYVFEEVIPYVLSINNKMENTYNSAHAHHSYLHFLGELGLVGFMIFILFWINLFKFINRNVIHKHLRTFFIIVFFNITFASFTEHRIVTPATILPFTLMLGLYIVSENYRRKNEKSINS